MSDTPPPSTENHVFDRPYSLFEPVVQSVPVVVDVPHSGRRYSEAFIASSRLSPHGLRRSEDAFVDRLFHDMVALGAPLLVAEFPRAFLDVNREPYELDPRMFEGALPAFANTRSLRVAGGLGTVPKMVGDGRDIYKKRIPVEEALMRIEQLYKPYHAALRELTNRTLNAFGASVLVDAHSMPSSSLDKGKRSSADLVLGDRFGTSAAGWIVDSAEKHLTAAGFRVIRNTPYAGGFITESYGTPTRKQHALQIEINRAIYMDEARIEPHSDFNQVRLAIRDALQAMMLDWQNGLMPRQQAAE